MRVVRVAVAFTTWLDVVSPLMMRSRLAGSAFAACCTRSTVALLTPTCSAIFSAALPPFAVRLSFPGELAALGFLSHPL